MRAFMGALRRVAFVDVLAPTGTSKEPMKCVNSISKCGLQSMMPAEGR